MSWISDFFKSALAKKILDMGTNILKLFAGHIANDLMAVAQREVSKAEASGATGQTKYEIALKGIRASYPELKESTINFAIETAVQALLAQVKK